MRARGQQFAQRVIQQGIDAGHTIGVTHREPPAEWVEHGARTKYWGSCSCGWKSTARFSQKVALGSAFHHLGQVVGDGAASPAAAPGQPGLSVRDGGVSLPADVRPAT